MKTHDFYFDLPEELIAQTPLQRRDGSRLLVLDKESGAWEHRHFYDLPDLHKQAQGTLGMVEWPAAGQAAGGMTEASLSDVLGGPESEDDLPPGR